MKSYSSEKIRIPANDGRMIHTLVLRHRQDSALSAEPSIGILWLHGGGYKMGFPSLVYISAAMDLLEKFNVTVFVPRYRLSGKAPYPAALNDAYDTLLYMKENAERLRIRKSQIMVGGESAGGGLTAALCIYARDVRENRIQAPLPDGRSALQRPLGKVNIAYQIPLYPMIDDRDTETNKNNNGKVWNTKKNRAAWLKYLRSTYPAEIMKASEAERPKMVPAVSVPPYAAPARLTDYHGLPPCYTFVARGEAFYAETLSFVEHLKAAGVPAIVDVHEVSEHAFDEPPRGKPEAMKARELLVRQFEYASTHYFAEN